MKRLFWSLLLAIGTAIGVWFFARRRMDALYGEVSHLREIERKYDAMLKNEAQRNTVFRDATADMEENAPLPPLTSEQKMKMAMNDAIYTAHAHESLGEHFIEGDDPEDDS